MPAAPPCFRFADEQEVKTVLSSAGFAAISTEVTQQVWRHPAPDQVFDAFNKSAVRATAMLCSQPENVRNIIRDIVRLEVSFLRNGDEYLIPVPAALSVGFKNC